jgi:hypothetical protein
VDTTDSKKKKKKSEEQTTAHEESAASAIWCVSSGAVPRCAVKWFVESQRLGEVLAKTTSICTRMKWTESRMLACAAAGRCMYESPHFLHRIVHHLDGAQIVDCLGQPEKELNLTSLVSIAIMSSYKLKFSPDQPEEFPAAFFLLQRALLEGAASCGEEPYECLTKCLTLAPGSLPCEMPFRCAIAFVIGQCALPPLAEVPVEQSDSPEGSPPTSPNHAAVRQRRADQKAAIPPVATCKVPPESVMRVLAQEISREDQRLRKPQHTDKGPIYSDLLVHSLYALAVTVPHHASLATGSAAVRNAALTQLSKVFRTIEHQVDGHKLYDVADGQRNKVFLYLRAVACVRAAIQCIAAGWLSTPSGPHIALTADQAGKDFVRFCSTNIAKTFDTGLIKATETPWEKVMLRQGHAGTVADLLIRACSTDANLAELGRIGGQQSLLSLSRVGETATVKQQATLFLTKLAVLTA